MNIKKLNEELKKFIEGVNFEYEPEADDILADIDNNSDAGLIKEILNGLYKGDSLDEIVLSNLDSFSVEELAKILDNYNYYRNCGSENLFPSNWNYKFSGKSYPRKLAEAICRSQDVNELNGLSDLFNIFYRQRGDLDVWGEAANVWADNVLRNISDVKQELDKLGDDGDYTQAIIEELEDRYPEICQQLQEGI